MVVHYVITDNHTGQKLTQVAAETLPRIGEDVIMRRVIDSHGRYVGIDVVFRVMEVLHIIDGDFTHINVMVSSIRPSVDNR